MLKLSLDALQILDAIDRRGSFASAGKELHKVPSTISYTVSKLEQDLGVQLFDRIGPRAHLTEAGVALLDEGRHLLRAARELEMRVRRVASGWEAELTVAVDSLFQPALLAEDVRAFSTVAEQTRIRLISEALSGTWEALLDRRADLLVGAAGEGPSGGGYVVEPLGVVRFVFAVAPGHPLAALPEPLGREQLAAHCAIAVADSARRLLPRTVGLLMGQETVTVPDTVSKFRLQCAGLGFGFLPEPYVQAAVAQGRLVVRQVEEPKPDETFWLAWRTGEEGAALRWWRERMRQPGLMEGWWKQMSAWL
ncbi:LysR family transcriptional regulator [Stenotrophomonas sp. SORGH_AS_0282]|uniref:LysR family transcriptional regulator n=1 Tax=Stenotrophomonas sp. SORGH_AS_0282 TaxID=3041763 RepID=UPI002780AFDF|nr:LysR family transcriptional regulator [Stenotrophomonas sp. SORGH_AS_0282]MDQ1063061.1 DNA-binding transcriptional LysR family regulator [Stenotrophomonas sp. SORGH_AS_0282]MDQ1188582.1 DNA-binding transcriptional LysR family regulator [Stenotrophomonas sp. SORGH_AS_0282]